MTYPYETATKAERRIGALWWLIHHQILCEPLAEPIEARVAYIRANQPAHEHETRLRALCPVRVRLPAAVVRACAAREKAGAAREKAGAAWEKANAPREKADAAWAKADAPREKAGAAWAKAHAAWEKANAALAKAVRANRPALLRAFRRQCPGIAWDAKTGLVFPTPEAR